MSDLIEEVVLSDSEPELVGGAMARRRSGSKTRRTVKRGSGVRRKPRSSGSKTRRVVKRGSGVKRKARSSGSKTRRVRSRTTGGARVAKKKRATRKPSAYNMFVKKFFSQWRRDSPSDYDSYSAVDRIRIAAEEWRNR